jgi:Trypsin
VRLGDQNLKTKTDGARDIDVDIAQFISHPQYSARSSKNDIALLRLAKTVR